MARTCVWCDKPLPAPKYKGHRRREFCNRSCQQKQYLWYKKIKEDATIIVEPYWRDAYKLLVERYKWVEQRLHERMTEAEKSEATLQYYKRRDEDMRIDYLGRLKALGMSEEDIKEFEEFWQDRS